MCLSACVISLHATIWPESETLKYHTVGPARCQGRPGAHVVGVSHQDLFFFFLLFSLTRLVSDAHFMLHFTSSSSLLLALLTFSFKFIHRNNLEFTNLQQVTVCTIEMSNNFGERWTPCLFSALDVNEANLAIAISLSRLQRCISANIEWRQDPDIYVYNYSLLETAMRENTRVVRIWRIQAHIVRSRQQNVNIHLAKAVEIFGHNLCCASDLSSQSVSKLVPLCVSEWEGNLKHVI